MRYAFKHTFFGLIILLICISFSSNVIAQSTTELINKIEERNNQIKKLEEEIKLYNQEIYNTNKEATNLKSTLKTLDLTKKKIGVDISLTENKISKTSLTIEQLNKEIDNAQKVIDINRQAIINAIRDTNELEDINIVQVILSNRNIGDIINQITDIKNTQEVIHNKSEELKVQKNLMLEKQNSSIKEKKNLLNLKQDLNGKKQAVIYTTKEKENLLTQTKNKEETYKALVKTREEQKAQFEKEVYEYESQLNLAIDPSKYPVPQNGILSWPLEYVYITQKFGKTVDAKKLYVSGSHNGVDFRASVGTKVINVLDGVVAGTGNTDAYPGCYSFGKWVLVRHNNGLSTIYGHLSIISVVSGQELRTGDVIGFSGNTGYSTGPHLHISVYATQGVRIEKYINSRGCKQATMPLADIKAYLDPLAYLPTL